MTRVLGTELLDAGDDDRPCTVLLSDLHVPLHGGRVLEDLTELLARAARRGAACRVLVLGDLLESLTGPKQLGLGAHREVVARLRATTGAGVSVSVLHGNRDFMLDQEFARRSGARVVAGGLRFQLGARRCLALHGDELCLRDLPYQRSKRWLRHPCTKAVLRRLPLGVALRVAATARATSQRTMQAGDQERFAPVARALQAVTALGVELLVFGHIHRPARGCFERMEYCVLPAFDQGGVHLVAEGAELGFRGVDGARVADYPARTFE